MLFEACHFLLLFSQFGYYGFTVSGSFGLCLVSPWQCGEQDRYGCKILRERTGSSQASSPQRTTTAQLILRTVKLSFTVELLRLNLNPPSFSFWPESWCTGVANGPAMELLQFAQDACDEKTGNLIRPQPIYNVYSLLRLPNTAVSLTSHYA